MAPSYCILPLFSETNPKTKKTFKKISLEIWTRKGFYTSSLPFAGPLYPLNHAHSKDLENTKGEEIVIIKKQKIETFEWFIVNLSN